MSNNPAARRRPTHRKGRPTLTRESVGQAALNFIDHHPAAELTMRSLAADLGVSPRALYNYVEDRRDLLTVAAELFESEWQAPALEPGLWRDSLRAYCRDLRAHYRRHPGMTTLALTENITMARHPTMLRNVDALIEFFESAGLSLADAYRACMETVRFVVGFVELQDSLYDRPPAHLEPADLEQLPPPWLRSETEDELPNLKRVSALEPDSPDTLFEFSMDIYVEGIAARRQA
ncbi:TetR/AcrR family transcriptional regulator C-terminal domain-containing protein [Streptomyces sp. ActVer]|uniref:TetR/AcrR family transcriptional regulator n=1 Tax=Streptomyces sp. ActVer TaxID=3014558 RepID=UPI0022B2B953|nr:TetR/AcrR family transcriptional regulator C-terminal domain-containing protein [Streptomyces sp. ActVer]MCZ4513835.1 TetR/AcrR family transcriptional regulator C-terminal domain-containing protein [Streptomyces sp. ActVer]